MYTAATLMSRNVALGLTQMSTLDTLLLNISSTVWGVLDIRHQSLNTYKFYLSIKASQNRTEKNLIIDLHIIS